MKAPVYTRYSPTYSSIYRDCGHGEGSGAVMSVFGRLWGMCEVLDGVEFGVREGTVFLAELVTMPVSP